MLKRLKVLLFVPYLFIFAVVAVAETTPMFSFNAPGVYAQDSVTGFIDTVDDSLGSPAIPEINPAETFMVFNDNGVIKLYNLLSKLPPMSIATVTPLNAIEGGNAVHFTADGKILFVDSDDYALKTMDTNGTNIVTVASPTAGYRFTYFALSHDRNKLAIIENVLGCTEENYYTCNTERLIVMNADGTSPNVIKSNYLGEWNLISWKQDSQALLYYHHYYSGGVPGPAQYTLFDLSGGSVITTDFSGGNWNSQENACVFTKNGNLLSMFYQELYDGRTGALIANVSSSVPNMMTGAIIGRRVNGEFYFADSDKSNFHQFIEPGFLYATFGSTGIWMYNGDIWSQVTPNSPETMVVSGSNLYGDFGSSGIWMYNGTTWSQTTPSDPQMMTVSGSTLYGAFSGAGIWMYNGTTWAQTTPSNPEAILAAGSTLYGDFGSSGIWMYNGTTWSQTTPSNPQMITVSGSTLYGSFSGAGIWMYNGSSWSQTTPSNPEAILASGSTLYGDFGSSGIWMYNGTTWSQLSPLNPEQMVCTATDLYADFGSSGIWKHNGTTWSQVTPNDPAGMVVSN